MTQKYNGKRPRITLYSHDTQGLGHLRRNLRIATTLASSHLSPDILLITGAREVAAFELPPRTDCLVLPGLGKQQDGQYHSRSLSIPLSASIQLRAVTIRAALQSFKPHIFIVDKVPSVAFGELFTSLKAMQPGGKTHCVLGLRDVLDDPVVVYNEWKNANSSAIVRAYYDAVWVYGDKAVYDPVAEYTFNRDIAAKTRFTGYIGINDGYGSTRLNDPSALSGSIPVRRSSALCLMGGGQDGYDLADSFVRAQLPSDTDGILVTGPFMSASDKTHLQRIAIARASLSNAQILVLDEPATGLDKENDRLVREALERVTQGRTVFIIAHDLASAEECDLIFYLEKGRVVESGSHQALLILDGRYAAMYQKQVQQRNQRIVESIYALEV